MRILYRIYEYNICTTHAITQKQTSYRFYQSLVKILKSHFPGQKMLRTSFHTLRLKSQFYTKYKIILEDISEQGFANIWFCSSLVLSLRNPSEDHMLIQFWMAFRSVDMFIFYRNFDRSYYSSWETAIWNSLKTSYFWGNRGCTKYLRF